jgi:pseudoazurin
MDNFRKMDMNRLSPIAVAAALSLALGVPAWAADHQVKMLNKGADGQDMVFEPAFLAVEPGDTVTFIAVDKGHDTESIKGLIPDGAKEWKGKINEEVKVELTTEGAYVYRCLPHYGMGMVGLIQVGKTTPNLEAVKAAKLPAKARQRLDPLIAQIGTGQ